MLDSESISIKEAFYKTALDALISRGHDFNVETIIRATKVTNNAFKALNVWNKNWVPDVELPKVAPAQWAKREKNDRILTPLEFYAKYWLHYEEVLTQKNLQDLDTSLFDAIKTFCRNRDMDAKDFLPEPARNYTKPKAREVTVENA